MRSTTTTGLENKKGKMCVMKKQYSATEKCRVCGSSGMKQIYLFYCHAKGCRAVHWDKRQLHKVPPIDEKELVAELEYAEKAPRIKTLLSSRVRPQSSIKSRPSND